MDIVSTIKSHNLILTEAAVLEALRRSGHVRLHHRLENALLIYDETGRNALSELYNGFISIAHDAGIPIVLTTPTWRANFERVSEENTELDINGDAVQYLQNLRGQCGEWTDNIGIGGLVGCKNDCYKPNESLPTEKARAFHLWQVERLSEKGIDFLLAATLPAVPEAIGIARAMEQTAIPYIISFVINRNGHVLDGTSLVDAIDKIDAACGNPPLGYMVNCAYPSFLNAPSQPDAVLSRLIGYQANSSSQEHSDLDNARDLQTDDIDDWGTRMIELNRKYGVKILGGCCGTGFEHLRYIARNYNCE